MNVWLLLVVAAILLIQIGFGGKLMSFADDLVLVRDQLRKAKAELVAKLEDLNLKISDLTAAVEAAGQTDPAVTAALADVQAVAQDLDDLVPDVEVPTLEDVPVEGDPIQDVTPEQ